MCRPLEQAAKAEHGHGLILTLSCNHKRLPSLEIGLIDKTDSVDAAGRPHSSVMFKTVGAGQLLFSNVLLFLGVWAGC